MNLPVLTVTDFLAVLPVVILALGATVVLLSEVFLSGPARSHQPILSAVTSVAAGIAAVAVSGEEPRAVFQGLGVLDPFSSLMTAVICVALALCSLLAAGFLRHRNAERGEFYALMLFGGAGMSLLAMSAELITLFINLEILSVATYALAAYLRRGPRPAEAGFKYFILGAFSAALLLYGAALLYGVTGTTRLAEMAVPLKAALTDKAGLTYCGLALLGVGFAFKVGAVPFHMWTPDVYEGAPTPATALMSAGVKAAAFAAMIRVFTALSGGLAPEIPFALLSTLAILTMVGGNLLALPQRNVKRMLAYSSIAHAGYLLLGVTVLFAPSGTQGSAALFGFASPTGAGLTKALASETFRSVVFYLLGYTVTTLGAFGLLGALERRGEDEKGVAWDLDRLSGLAQRRPGWAAAMAIFMLSLGGIPPTVGFMAKLLVFRAAVDAGLWGLAVVGVLSSAAGIYYYLRVIVYMFMKPAPAGAAKPESYWATDVALLASTVGVLLLGLFPGSLGTWLARAGMMFGAP